MPRPHIHIKKTAAKLVYLALFLMPFSFISAAELDSLTVTKQVESLKYMPVVYRLKLYPDIISYYKSINPAKALQYCYEFEEDVAKLKHNKLYSNYMFYVYVKFRNVYYAMDNYSKAQEYALRSYNRAVELEMQDVRFWSLHFLLKIFYEAEVYEKIGDRIGELMSLTGNNNLFKIVTLIMQSDYLLRTNKPDSAIYYLEQGLTLNKDSLRNKHYFTEMYLRLADIFNLKKDYNTAFRYYEYANRYALEDDYSNRCKAYIEMASIKGIKREFDLSDFLFEKAKFYIDEDTGLPLLSTYYLYRARVEELKGHFLQAAYYYKMQAKVLTDINSNSLKAISRNYENLNKVYSKEVENKQLRLDNEVKEDRINQARLINFLILGLMIVILVAALYTFRQKSRTSKLERLALTQQSQLNEKILKEQVHVLEIEATKSYIDGQERERDRIGRDLHDGVGGALAGVRMLITSAYNNTKLPELNDVVLKIQKIYQDVRNLSHDLVKPDIVHDNFEMQIANLTKQFELNKKDASLSFYPNIRWDLIDQGSLVQLYRIVQEAFLNILKHANAQNIDIQFLYNEDDAKLNVSIEDDGEGFPESQFIEGIGMQNMRTRVNILKGELEIDSNPGKGTYINIVIPIEYKRI